MFHRRVANALAYFVALTASSLMASDVKDDIKNLCEAHTRVVWVQDAGDTACVYSERATLRLMAFDSRDNKGERAVLPNIARFFQPLITDDGTRIMFGDLDKKTVNIINWDGSGLKTLLSNATFNDVWTDPRTGAEWFYATTEEQRGDKIVPVIRRYRIDNPSNSELVWDKLPIHHFMLSGDGRSASGGGDGGNSPQGVLFLPNGSFNARAGGCWPSMAPDNSLRSWVFTGNHRSIHFCFTTDKSGKGYSNTLNFDKTPGLELSGQEELYHPRWTNDVRFITATAPLWKWSYQAEAKIPNDVAAKVEIYIGKFSADMKSLERWVKVTNNDRGDYWPNAWIEQPKGPPAWLDAGPELANSSESDVLDTSYQVFLWNNGADTNQLIDASTGAIQQCNGDFRDAARFERYHVMDLNEGAFVPKDTAEPWLKSIRSNQAFSIEMAIQPQELGQAKGSVLLALGKTIDDSNLVLSQVGSTLMLKLRDSEALPLVELGASSQHLVVSYASGKLECFLDGQQVLLTSSPKVDFTKWSTAPLVFGDAWEGGHNWAGLMEGLGLFGRAIGIDEAQQRHHHLMESRKDRQANIPQVVIDATLMETCPPADPKGIAPYRRCFSLQQFKVDKVVSGTCKDELISVAQWSVLDAKVVDEYLTYKKGKSYRLILEPWSMHPEQESERMISGDFLEEGELYYQVREARQYNPSSASVQTNRTPIWHNQAGTAMLTQDQHIFGEARPEIFTDLGKKDTHGQNVVIENPSLDEVALKGELRLGGQDGLRGIAVIAGGDGYSRSPEIIIEGDGQGAKALALMSLSDIEISHLGSGYKTAPKVVISQPDVHGGRRAEATAIIDANSGALSTLYITNPGSGYLRAPRIQFEGGEGEGAEIYGKLTISDVHVSSSGKGYRRRPKVTVNGDGQGAQLSPLFQSTLLRYSGDQGSAQLLNQGRINQDTASITFDWAAENNNTAKRGVSNQGEWLLNHGSIINFIFSTGRPFWFGPLVNSGNLHLLDHSIIEIQNIDNQGMLELGAGSVLGHSRLSNNDSSLLNRGTLLVSGGTAMDPARYGVASSEVNYKRIFENGDDHKATCTIGKGSQPAALEITGGEAIFNNHAKASLHLATQAQLSLISNDAGSQHMFHNRSAVVNNEGEMIFAGQLRVKGNQGGFTGIKNQGNITLQGNDISLLRLPSSSGPGAYYSDKTLSTITNTARGSIVGQGAFRYINETGSAEAAVMELNNEGLIALTGTLQLANVIFNHTGTLRLSVPEKVNRPVITIDNKDGKPGLILGENSRLDLVQKNKKALRGTFRIINAQGLTGKFKELYFNGSATTAYTVTYLDNGIDIVFK